MLLDYQIEAIQRFFAHDSRRERARRAWIIKRNLHIDTTNKRTQWNHSIVLEKIKIRQIMAKHGLDQYYITVSEKDFNIEVPETKGSSRMVATDIATIKPIVLCNDDEIRRYVQRTLPLLSKQSEKDAYINGIDRRALSRSLKKVRRWGIGIIAQELHYIGGKTKNTRVTPAQRSARKKVNKENQKWLENTEIHGKNGTVHKLIDSGVTAKKRIAELTCVADGIQKHCESIGWVWASCVVKLEPNFHPNPTKGKYSWDFTTPQEALRILMSRWASVRAMLGKDKIEFAGLRTVEAHEDGCPHVNFLIYFDRDNEDQVRNTFKSIFGDGGENDDGLCYFMPGITGEGAASFSSYAFKYFEKYNKDGADVDNACLEEQAWASTWGIRRFDTFGIPSLSNWRILRSSTIKPKDRAIAELWKSARDGEFDVYIYLNGGLNLPNSKRIFSTIKALSTTGRSKVTVGIHNKANGADHIIKDIGFWTLKTKDPTKPTAICLSNYIPVTRNDEDRFFRTFISMMTGKRQVLAQGALNKKHLNETLAMKWLLERQKTVDIIYPTDKAACLTSTSWSAGFESVSAKAEYSEKLTSGKFKTTIFNDVVTVVLSYASKVKNDTTKPENPQKLASWHEKPLPVNLKKYREAQKIQQKRQSHREAVLAEIVKRRSVHASYGYRLQMINADLASAGLAPVSGMDHIH